MLPVDATDSTLSRDVLRPSLLPTPLELAIVFVLGRLGGSLGVPASLTAVEFAGDGRRGGRAGRGALSSSSPAESCASYSIAGVASGLVAVGRGARFGRGGGGLRLPATAAW